MEQFRFRSWGVYKDSQQLYTEVTGIVQKLPREHRYGAGDQLLRSALSIILNMAEGSGKSTTKDLSRFLDISLGSAYETLACLDTLTQNNFITKEKFEELEKKLESICNQIGGFKKKLRA